MGNIDRKELLELALAGVDYKIAGIKQKMMINPDLLEKICYEMIEMLQKREKIENELAAIIGEQRDGEA